MPITTQSGFAADNRPEAPRPYPAGAEKATVKNADLGHNYGDLANTKER